VLIKIKNIKSFLGKKMRNLRNQLSIIPKPFLSILCERKVFAIQRKSITFNALSKHFLEKIQCFFNLARCFTGRKRRFVSSRFVIWAWAGFHFSKTVQFTNQKKK
jgi:hypothetical protein